MEVISSVEKMQQWRNKDEKIAFVATMGGLHEGHLSLIEVAKRRADRVVVSVFVNPAQFSENEDFGTYPRNLDEDLALFKTAGVDVVFTPDIEQIYPDGVDENFDIGWIGQILCGKTRPHFFNGVVQVVSRLFEIVQPDIAVFGQKDYQQLQAIKRFTSGVEIVSAAIVREENGLAMSTRNQYLSADECQIAAQLYQTLLQLQQGKIDKKSATERLQKHFKLDYLQILDANTLKQINSNTSKIAILCAVYLGKTRLIDNLVFNKEG
ncbi:Pantoate--beta-alanine ligase [uncultured Candidatus Thioglobus sp.]|nr:Pantoate--beta-alanine ligase [uncultured Candidatus Thioglobus sp.]